MLALLLLTIMPDMSGIMPLIGKGTLAHACPISPVKALTAAHVVSKGGEDESPRFHHFQQGDVVGTTNRVEVFEDADIALVWLDKPVKKFYPLAPTAPIPGEKLFLRGFDFRRQKDALAPRDWEVTVLRTVAGHVVFKPGVEQGTSGSCILNQQGEVVGIVAFGVSIEGGSEAVVGVGVWKRE